jgi:hypothetical protein
VSPDRVADGSSKTKSPFEVVAASVSAVDVSLDSTGGIHTPQVEFGAGFIDKPRRSNMVYGLIAISILVAGGIVAVVLASQGGKDDKQPVANTEAAIVAPETPTADPTKTAVAAGVANPETGFDLIVDPQGVKVSLDGRPIGKAPLQIRSLRPGEHFIEIEAPAGFFSKHESVMVVSGTADRVVIRLGSMDITGKFVSEPEGANVSLVADGVSVDLGVSPVEYKLDPRKRYEVVFKKSGYATVTKPVEISGSPVVSVAGTLTRARSGSSQSRPLVETDPVATKPETPKPVTPPTVKEKPTTKPNVDKVVERPKPPPSASTGTLLLASKPPCKIFINGRDTGKTTPQRKLELPTGTHRITLVNNEHGIKDTFSVKIKANTPTKSIKNFTSQIK